MLSEALQRNAKHEARLSNISVPFICEKPTSENNQRFFSRDCGTRMTFARWVKSCFRVIRVSRG